MIKIFKYILFSSIPIILLVTFIVLGYILPPKLISDGAEQFNNEEWKFAKYALNESGLMLGGSLEPLFITAYKVTTVKKISNEPRKCGLWPSGEEDAYIYGDYQATVRLYSYYGIPYGELAIKCQGEGSMKRFYIVY
ncbi:hypothetical protein A2982_01270 [candidate division WWE3 bacterium RIFCSPLOWO2_01_FULL_39_13]|uniref:Uncharacterized protein n=1 Tax=candidate division WWE3 bacterium RIFCSPLOWO2_01_FULL_39_13 TaxID=1802624 RepID=A0A1F4V357_UNCKA|nr:MAG: hypothetical protein A2982_01270 [candidate division WWE3 bacterium RIFCSPLOWO2_01_FULL_39_13]